MLTLWSPLAEVFALQFDLEDYATTYRATRWPEAEAVWAAMPHHR